MDRLYLKRAEGGRGLKTACMYMFQKARKRCSKWLRVKELLILKKTKGDLLETKSGNLKRKKLRGVFFKNTEFRDEQTWNWLRKGDLKKATEGTIMAAQEQAIRTRSIRHRIDNENISPLCRLCGERDETVAHLVSECMILCQTQYKKRRHDRIAQVIHWELCKAYDLEHMEKWYDHHPEKIKENEKVKTLWDMNARLWTLRALLTPELWEKRGRKWTSTRN